jgi:formylglycine-generating enzyme required for sulfatase activity
MVASGGAVAQSKCTALQLKFAAKAAFLTAKCEFKAVKKGIEVDPECLAKAEAFLAKKWEAAIGKGDCMRSVAQNAAQSHIDSFVDVLVNDFAGVGTCPSDMVATDLACVDRYEAPNKAGELPLVMYTLNEAEAWCESRAKRLCFDDEWEGACEGMLATSYPYGDTHLPGVCNDEQAWMAYNQSLISSWPSSASSSTVDSLADLLADARSVSQSAADSADHIEFLYQGEASGSNASCGSDFLIFDLTGNVEEWTKRRDGGTPGFTGNQKGNYWAEAGTCQSNSTVHGDAFRFYQLGFRCCTDLP